MRTITIEKKPSAEKLRSLGMGNWPIWEKEISEFPWKYDEQETCYFLDGEVVVTPAGGDPVTMGKGDLVTFPRGLSCRWKILKDIRKHYTFG